MDVHQATKVLATPLQFGNIEQIEASRLLYPPLVDAEGKKRYRIDISVSYDETIYVYAVNESAARCQALEQFDVSDCEADFTVREVGP
jgi:hypothetical protein